MRWKPVVVLSERSDGSLVVAVGHPLADAYLEFLGARARPNTIRAVAFDLKVFFSFVDKTPARVTSADVMSFITVQRSGGVDSKVVRIDRSEGLSPRTIRRRLSSVSGFYAYLMVRDDTSVTRNPVPRGLVTRHQRSGPRRRVPLVRTPITLPKVLSTGRRRPVGGGVADRA
jgi:integrase/recombinase XerD